MGYVCPERGRADRLGEIEGTLRRSPEGKIRTQSHPRMGTSRDDFVKYPRTPHLFGSKGTDDDRHLGPKESAALVADPSLIVEEKLDGTNVGIHFTVAGRMVLQCRHEITEGCILNTISSSNGPR